MGARCSSLALAPTKRPSYDLQPELLDNHIAQLSDLPPKLLDLVIAGLHDPADLARARAVCHSWHAAVRRQSPQPWRLPSTMSLSLWRRINSLPRGAEAVGSTNDWFAIRVGKKGVADDGHSSEYFLYNPFVNKTVPLTELEDVIGHHKSKIYKFLMRSGAEDLIAVIARNGMHAFMVIRPGKGVWLPPPWTCPYIDIIDFAFLQGKLYAITTGEDLIPFDLTLDGEGRPLVTMGKRLIKQPPEYNGLDVWPPSDSDDDDDDENEEVEAAPNEEDGDDEEQQVTAAPNEEEDDEAPYPNDNTTCNCSVQFWPYNEPDDLKITNRHLIESRGKLLMVRHHQEWPRSALSYITIGVEVLEADTDAGAWMPVTGGLGGGRALFISLNFSKCVPAPCGEVEEDVIYFMDTGEVFDLKSGTSSPSQLCSSYSRRKTWLFHPELVV